MVKKNKFNLKELIENIDWQLINIATTKAFIRSNEVGAGFRKKNKKSEQPDEVIFRIGIDLFEKLKWQFSDKIAVFNNPDDIMTFMLAKSDSGVGYTLQRETNNPSNGRIVFRWYHSIPLNEKKVVPIEYEISKGRLIFRANDSENHQ